MTFSAKDQATKPRLEKLSGAQFDKAYMRDMVNGTQKDVTEFERASKMAKKIQKSSTSLSKHYLL